MNISLTPELDNFVNDKVASGMYHSASEVIREGLRLLKEQDTLKNLRVEALKKEIASGIEQADRGQFIQSSLVANRIKEKSAKRRKATT
jgi:antitoxin ParD1/3/4